MSYDIPRRHNLDENTKIELDIFNIITEIESLGADPKLTTAQIKLQEARDLIADFVDELNGSIKI